MYCALLAPQWKAKSQLYLRVRKNTWYIKCFITPVGKQPEQEICTNIVHHRSKKAYFFACKRTVFVNQMAWRFCKNDYDSSLESLIVTRVESFGKNVIRAVSPSFLNVNWDESPKIMTPVEPLARSDTLAQDNLSLARSVAFLDSCALFVGSWVPFLATLAPLYSSLGTAA